MAESEPKLIDEEPISSLYIHVPFCKSKCHYCDFYSLATDDADKIKFWHETVILELSRLKEEAKAHSVVIKPLKTIYYGGGTPSLLPVDYLAEQLQLCQQLFGLAAENEISLEANPEQIKSPAIAAAWLELGINRLSIGIQSASNHLLKVMGRRHSREEAEQAVLYAHKAGFDNISVDLISALPDSNLLTVKESLDFILQLPITHVSTYALDVPKQTVFARLLKEEAERFPSDEVERQMYYLIRDTLVKHGFQHYEISNFALPNYYSRHNSNYWLARPYLAAGPAASSYMSGVRRSNFASLEKWHNLIKTEGPFSQKTITERIDAQEAERETMWLGMRLMRGVNSDDFYQRHGRDYRKIFAHEIDKLQKQGLIIYDGENCRLSKLGEDFANVVFREFV